MDSSIYSPLGIPDSIRLLRLLRGTYYHNDAIRCELFEAPLPADDKDEAYYDALSYTWGDDAPTNEIIIQGRPVAVTSNLFQALEHLRLPDEDRILWIDAICINQADLAERARQVGMMAVIYKKAHEVVIWLGMSTPDIDLLMEAARLLDAYLLRQARPPDDPDRFNAWLFRAKTFLDSLAPELRERRKDGLRQLLCRPWWTRIWVVQETANARKARVQCARTWVPTRTFALLPGLFGLQTGPREQALLEVMPGPLRQQSWWRRGSDRNLATLLAKFAHCQSKEPHDQVYGLLGLLPRCYDHCLPKADYTLPMRQVVGNTASFLVFGEVLYDCPLPAWDLTELRKLLPDVTSAFFEWAVQGGHRATVERLLRVDLPRGLLKSRSVSQSLLHVAITADASPELLVALLEHGRFDINGAFHGFTPLSRAASVGRTDLIRLLAARLNVQLTRKDPDGYSPAGRAAENGHLDALDLLVALDGWALRDEGGMLLGLAVRSNDADMLRRLLQHQGLDVNQPVRSRSPGGLAVTLGDVVGKELPIFWYAVYQNQPRMMRMLADAGAAVTISDDMNAWVWKGEWALIKMPCFLAFVEERGLDVEKLWRPRREGRKVSEGPALREEEWLGPEDGATG